MRKFYTQMLVLLALVVSGGAFGQTALTGLTVSPGPYCPNNPVQISWTTGSGGGGAYTINIDTLSMSGFVSISSQGMYPASPFTFYPGVAGATYRFTVYGQSGPANGASVIFTYDDANVAPTTLTVDGIANGLLCPAAVSADLSTQGGTLGSGSNVVWYDNSMTQVFVGATYTAAPVAGFPYTVAFEGCDTASTVFSAPATYAVATAPTNFTTDITLPACAGQMVTFTGVGGTSGIHPDSDTIFSLTSNGVGISNPYTVGSGDVFTNFFVRIVDACDVATLHETADLGPITVGATTPVVGTLSNNGVAPICPTNIINFQAAGYTLGAGSFEFSVDTGTTWNPVTTGMDNQDISATVSMEVAFRITSSCGVTDSSVSSIVVSVPNVQVDSVTASATQVCAGTNVTFQAYNAPITANGVYEYSINGGAWTANGVSSSLTIPVSVSTQVAFQIVDDCGTSASAVSPIVDVATDNVEPTTLTPDDAGPVCSGTLVTWTADGSLSDAVANPAVYQFSTTGFADTAYTGTSNVFAYTVTANTTVSVRIVNGCGPQGTVITNMVNVTAGSTAPTDLTAEDMSAVLFADGDSICNQNITLTAVGYVYNVVDNGQVDFGTVSNGVFTSISGPQTTGTYTLAFSADANYAVEYTSTCISAPNVIDSIQLFAAIDNVNATSLDISDNMSNPVADGSTICSAGQYYFVMTGGTLGTGATYQFTYTVDAGAPVVVNPSIDTLVLDMDMLNPTSSVVVSAAIVGGCTDYSAMGYTVSLNFIGGSTPYTTIAADADNFCANAGVTATITATGGGVSAGSNTVWYELDQLNNIVSLITSAPATAIATLSVSPTVTTTYGVRIEGCDTTAFRVHTVLVKDTSIAPTVIGVSPSGPVCAGATVALTANGGTPGFGANYKWYDLAGNPVGTGNPIFLTVSDSISVQVRLEGACNISGYSAPTLITVLTDDNAFTTSNGVTCPNVSYDLAGLVSPTGGTFSGTGVSGHFFTGTTAGTVQITYTKVFGTCTFDTVFDVTVLPAPTAVASNIVATTCGVNNGSFDLTASGGTSGGTYTFSNGMTSVISASNPYNFSGLAAGSYLSTVSDDNGCVSPAISVVISNTSGLNATETHTDATCYDQSNGEIVVTATGGTNPKTYAISTDNITFSSEQSSNVFSGLHADIYYVRVTDATSCTFTLTVNITEPLNPIDLTVDYYSDVTCYGGTNGEIVNLQGAGGVAPYTYSVNGSPFDTTTSYTDLLAGTYVITVKDAGTCEADFTFSIEQPDQIVADVAIVDYSAADGYDIKITRTGGTGSLQIKLNNGDYTLDEDFTNLAPGVYTYSIQDNNGCTVTGEFTLVDPSSVGSVEKSLEYTVFPNPFSGNLTLKGEIAASAQVTMVDVYGKTVAVEVVRNGDTATINTENLAKGMYILNISVDGKNMSSKVIKN